MWFPSFLGGGIQRKAFSIPIHQLDAVSSPHPTVLAVETVRQMRGSTGPLLLRCNDGKYYVVKFHRRCVRPHALANEMFAGQLAILIGLPVPDPVVVQVPRALDGETPGSLELAKDSSLQFGSTYPDTPSQMLVTDFLPERLLRRVANAAETFLGAFVFDLWICNSGRREAIFTRPAGEDGAPYSAWLIDHDACFNNGTWKLPSAFTPRLYSQRVAYRDMRGVESFEPFLSRIENLEAREIENLARGVPPEWCGYKSEDIRSLAADLFRRRKLVRHAVEKALQNWRQ